MADMMTFPDTVEEFMEQYKIVDTDGIYMSKGAELVPIFRMRQWFEHLPSAQPEPQWISVSERLPEEYKRVLVSDVFGVYVGEFVDAEENWGGKHFIDAHGIHSISVKAWQPLPEPYREEGE